MRQPFQRSDTDTFAFQCQGQSTCRSNSNTQTGEASWASIDDNSINIAPDQASSEQSGFDDVKQLFGVATPDFVPFAVNHVQTSVPICQNGRGTKGMRGINSEYIHGTGIYTRSCRLLIVAPV